MTKNFLKYVYNMKIGFSEKIQFKIYDTMNILLLQIWAEKTLENYMR